MTFYEFVLTLADKYPWGTFIGFLVAVGGLTSVVHSLAWMLRRPEYPRFPKPPA